MTWERHDDGATVQGLTCGCVWRHELSLPFSVCSLECPPKGFNNLWVLFPEHCNAEVSDLPGMRMSRRNGPVGQGNEQHFEHDRSLLSEGRWHVGRWYVLHFSSVPTIDLYDLDWTYFREVSSGTSSRDIKCWEISFPCNPRVKAKAFFWTELQNSAHHGQERGSWSKTPFSVDFFLLSLYSAFRAFQILVQTTSVDLVVPNLEVKGVIRGWSGDNTTTVSTSFGKCQHCCSENSIQVCLPYCQKK